MKKPLNIHLYVTDKCNLSCKHCYNASWINTNSSTNLELKEIIYVIKNLHEKYDVDFHIEGGETFLWKPIFELLRQLDDEILKSITLTTNGTIPIVQYSFLLEKINQLRISVCGHTDEMQKILRNVPINPILENVFLLKNEYIPINMRMTLHKRNFKEIFDSLNFYSEHNLKNISIYEFQSVGAGKLNENEFKLDNDSFIDFLTILSHFDSSHIDKLKINFNKSRIKQIEAFREKLSENKLKVKILENEPSLTINYNGDVGICPWVVGEDTIFNIRNGNFPVKIEQLYNNNAFLHECDYCSVISIYE